MLKFDDMKTVSVEYSVWFKYDVVKDDRQRVNSHPVNQKENKFNIIYKTANF